MRYLVLILNLVIVLPAFSNDIDDLAMAQVSSNNKMIQGYRKQYRDDRTQRLKDINKAMNKLAMKISADGLKKHK